MNLHWSLNELYPSFESKEFKNDLILCDNLIEEINNWSLENLKETNKPVDKIEFFLRKIIKYNKKITMLMAYSQLRLSVEAKNNEAIKYIEFLEEKQSRIIEPVVKFQKWLGSHDDFESIINNSKLTKEHEFYLKELKNRAKYLLSENEEVIISRMSNTGSNAWTKLQQLLTSTLMIEIDGENVPLSVVRNMAYNEDPEVRKKAYQAEINSYQKIEDSVAASLNAIKGEVITVNRLRGYKSPLEETLIKSRLDSVTLEVMLSAIKENLHYFHKYYRHKAKLLGHKEGLPFYDLFAPVGKSNMTFTYKEAQNFIVENFRTFSNPLANYARKAFDKAWIDAEPREGKRGGAFCYNLHPIGESRILTNFTGSFSDVTTLAHELGHGYHGYCLMNKSILNSNYPMPLAETASIFCETIVERAAFKKANIKDAFVILENSISSAGQVIVDIYSRYLFESKLFKKRKKSSLSVDELKSLMIEAQKEAYGDGLDQKYLHPYMWICKPHYYSANLNYYNFPYAFGLLFGKGLYNEYLKRGNDFVGIYDKLLSATGDHSVTKVAKLINIDINSKEFWLDSLQLIVNDIEKFIKLSP